MAITIEVSAGELIDRITILEIKLSRLPKRVRSELERDLRNALSVRARTVSASVEIDHLADELRAVNRQLWDVEEELRRCEREGSFDGHFVELARTVYQSNDRRSILKSKIDELASSRVREYKSYKLGEVSFVMSRSERADAS